MQELSLAMKAVLVAVRWNGVGIHSQSTAEALIVRGLAKQVKQGIELTQDGVKVADSLAKCGWSYAESKRMAAKRQALLRKPGVVQG